MYSIFYINFGYGPEIRFETADEAIAYGKSKCFEFTVYRGNEMIASWSPIGGLRLYSR